MYKDEAGLVDDRSAYAQTDRTIDSFDVAELDKHNSKTLSAVTVFSPGLRVER